MSECNELEGLPSNHLTSTAYFEWAYDFSATQAERIDAEILKLCDAIKAFAESADSLYLIGFNLSPPMITSIV
jgi:hypothetical protein